MASYPASLGAPQKKNKNNKRVLLANRDTRKQHQQQIDSVDIGRPTRWLHYESAAAIKLRRQAQNDLQLVQDSRERLKARGLGHSTDKNAEKTDFVIGEREELYYRRRQGALPHVYARERSPEYGGRVSSLDAAQALDLEGRVLRACRASETVPWGTWPVRLKNHEGQNFYGDNRQVGGFANCRKEDDIHDRILGDSLEAPPTATEGKATDLAPRKPDEHAAIVKRLLPSTDPAGGWIEVSLPPPRTMAKTCNRKEGIESTVADGVTKVGIASNAGSCRADNDGNEFGGEAVDTLSTEKRKVSSNLSRLEPGWYGGWVEVDVPTGSKEKRRRVDAGADVVGASISTTASTAPAKTTTATSRSGGMEASDTAASSVPGKTSNGSQEQGRTRHGHRVTCSAEASRHCDAGAGYDYDNGHAIWQGWTVSEPAKETVRRVWARASRRAQDACDPRLVSTSTKNNIQHANENTPIDSGSSAIRGASGSDDDTFDLNVQHPFETLDEESSNERNGDEKTSTMGSSVPFPFSSFPAQLPAVRDTLDPALLTSLSRECEGIIDAALHVVLTDRRLRSAEHGNQATSSDGTSATRSTTRKERSSSETATLPLPLEISNWEDVLKAMVTCYSAAKRTGAGSTKAVGIIEGELLDGNVAGDGAKGSGDTGATRRTGVADDSEDARIRFVDGDERESTAGGAGKQVACGTGGESDGAVVVVDEKLPALPLNEAVLTRTYNRLLLYLHEKRVVFGRNVQLKKER